MVTHVGYLDGVFAGLDVLDGVRAVHFGGHALDHGAVGQREKLYCGYGHGLLGIGIIDRSVDVVIAVAVVTVVLCVYWKDRH